MASYLWLCCTFTLLHCSVAREYNVSLLITPSQNNNIKICNVNDVIDYVCKAEYVVEIPNGINLFWYLNKTNTLTLIARNDDNPFAEKDKLRFRGVFSEQHDGSEFFCIAKTFDDRSMIIGKSESIQLILNRTHVKLTEAERGILNTDEEITERNKNNSKNESKECDKLLTPLIVVSVIAGIIIILLVLAVIYLHRRNKRTTENGNKRSPLHEPMYLHMVSNTVNEYAEPILPPNKIYMNC